MQFSVVRERIAAAASNVVMPAGAPELVCTGYVPDGVTAPCFFVAEFDVEYDKAFRRGMDSADFTARVLVGRADDKSAQQILDSLLSGSGTGSLKTAIEAARGAPGEAALGGAAADLHVRRVQGYRWYEHNGTQYVGAELIIHVIGSG
ncbi:hypothetical protein PYK79_13330 [Streptomyces sp. ID05-04B]|uniref:hypothetical protein n=1 Tax=Streptomyces sp. ID05-04B TaxID=3028661 RepID=UPI0029C384AD|nr:hypothetical protein [Streptomyces sp. ID05-04B]MDX5564128.1 hypothetical protein [Streptomyces sp. ID05-04B]